MGTSFQRCVPAVALLLLACCCAAIVAPVAAVSGFSDDVNLQSIIAVLTAKATLAAPKQMAAHPLDPLTYTELYKLEQTLKFKVPRNVECKGAAITPVTPTKAYVKSWKLGQPLNRAAFASCTNKTSFDAIEITLALPSANITSIKELPGSARRTNRATLPTRPRWNIDTNVSQALLKPASTFRKFGVGFTVTGNQVRWGNWRFHVRWDGRAGQVLSLLQYYNGGAADAKGGWRDVAYEMHIAELFVPYLSKLQSNAYFDGSFGLGLTSNPLIPNNDCPHGAVYIHGVSWGFTSAQVYPNAICIFERYSGDIAWRHGTEYTKADVSLVVRSLSVIGNYDYLFDYEFMMDGTIRPKAQATGYPETVYQNEETLKASGIDPTKDGDDGIGGTYVDANTIAPIHDHFFSYRLDLDIDGTGNSFVEGKLVGARGNDGFGGTFDYVKVVKTTAVSEATAIYSSSVQNPSQYLITNPSKRTALGNVVGYQIHSSSAGRTFKTATDQYGACVPWARTQFTITAYDRTQRTASGESPYCDGTPTDGLAVYSKLNRPLKNHDIVVWHTIGFHHIPSQENWPYMSRAIASFTLEPFNFFEKNPLLFLPTWQDADVV